MSPFANESEVLEIGGLTLENRLDRVSLHGELDLTRDQRGLAHARALRTELEKIVAALESAPLPDVLPPPQNDSIDNPFL